MILLDENTARGELEDLQRRRLPVRKVGSNWGRQSMSDDGILVELRRSIRVHPAGIAYWERNATREIEVAWS